MPIVVPILTPIAQERNDSMDTSLLSGLVGAILGAGGVIISQLIANHHSKAENEKQRTMEAAIKLTEMAAAHGRVDPLIPASNNDGYVDNYNRILSKISAR